MEDGDEEKEEKRGRKIKKKGKINKVPLIE